MKPEYDAHARVRAEFGCKGGEVHRSLVDPNEVVLLLRWDSPERSHDFVARSDLQEVMARAGVVESPTIVELTDPLP